MSRVMTTCPQSRFPSFPQRWMPVSMNGKESMGNSGDHPTTSQKAVTTVEALVLRRTSD